MFWVLLIVVLTLAMVDLFSMAAVSQTDQASVTFESDIVQSFDFGWEWSLPTWLQSVMIAACAVLLLVSGAEHRQSGRRHGLHWVVLVAIFFSVSADEMLGAHKQSIVPIRSMF